MSDSKTQQETKTLTLQQVINDLISMIHIGQQKGAWTLDQAVSLHHVETFLKTTPIMVVPDNILTQLKQKSQEEIVSMTTQQVKNKVPRGSETM